MIERTRCNYGASRPWFRCPRCNRRVAIIYGVSFDYLCRHCYGLAYNSQSYQDDLDRMIRQARKIRRRLGASDDLSEPIYERPKGMWWSTYNQLVEEEGRLLESIAAGMSELRY